MNDGLIWKICNQLIQLKKKKKKKEPKQPNWKMGRMREWTFFQGGHTDGQKAHEKIFNITS